MTKVTGNRKGRCYGDDGKGDRTEEQSTYDTEVSTVSASIVAAILADTNIITTIIIIITIIIVIIIIFLY